LFSREHSVNIEKLLLFCPGVRSHSRERNYFCSVLAFAAIRERETVSVLFCSLLFRRSAQVEMEGPPALFRGDQSVDIEKLLLFCSGVRSHSREINCFCSVQAFGVIRERETASVLAFGAIRERNCFYSLQAFGAIRWSKGRSFPGQ
jgi:hypothetical protein